MFLKPDPGITDAHAKWIEAPITAGFTVYNLLGGTAAVTGKTFSCGHSKFTEQGGLCEHLSTSPWPQWLGWISSSHVFRALFMVHGCQGCGLFEIGVAAFKVRQKNVIKMDTLMIMLSSGTFSLSDYQLSPPNQHYRCHQCAGCHQHYNKTRNGQFTPKNKTVTQRGMVYLLYMDFQEIV